MKRHDKPSCFAYSEQFCLILYDKDCHDCAFFKTQQQLDQEEEKRIKRENLREILTLIEQIEPNGINAIKEAVVSLADKKQEVNNVN